MAGKGPGTQQAGGHVMRKHIINTLQALFLVAMLMAATGIGQLLTGEKW